MSECSGSASRFRGSREILEPSKGRFMTTVNEPDRANRGAAPGRSPTHQPATDRLCEQAREVTQELQEMGNTASDAVRENLGKLQDEVSEYYEQGRDQACQAEQTFEQY